jgi:DNA-3-methyladenine glycosylase
MTEGPAWKDFHAPAPGFFSSGVLSLAPGLLGCLLVHVTRDGPLSGVITETEAYHESEPSCHAFGGENARNWPMFRRGGLAYVYRIYGIHDCFNVCTGGEGTGEAVLIRALRPMSGIGVMERNRGIRDTERLCRGPGNLCRALGIDTSMNGADLGRGPLRVLVPRTDRAVTFRRTTRIGISKAPDREWRFVSEDLEHP